MNNWQVFGLTALMITTLGIGGCGSERPAEHYVSPKIQGEAARINLEEVQKAFWDTKGKDFNGWMAAFEKRVNQIYDGKEVVSIDATRNNGRLVVTGYVNKLNQDGYKPGDDKLFSIEQTGEAVNNEMPYRVADQNDRPYYEGHHSFLDNPIVQMMIMSHLMGGGGGWGGHYYTPGPQVVVLGRDRDSFRMSPSYTQQQQSNSSFYSRFKTKVAGGNELQSKKGFGSAPFGSSSSTTNATKQRTWGGSTTSEVPHTTPSTSAASGWGGRRSSGFGTTTSGFGGGMGMRRSSWGRRR